MNRRRSLRVPIRGTAVIHAQEGPLQGALENLSYSGALVNVTAPLAAFFAADVELHLSSHAGCVAARTVRVEVNPRRRWRIAVAFDRVEAEMRDAIDDTITTALAAARKRPILVLDDDLDRRAALIDLLVTRGMTPLAPNTPLDAIEMLTRPEFHVDVCLLSPANRLASLIDDSFPWVTPTPIDDDIETCAGIAIATWGETPLARLGTAIA
jgi:hypothetical protein